MTGVWALAALWLGLALVASLLSIWFRISTALSEIVVGTIAQLIIGAAVGSAILGTNESWIKFLSVSVLKLVESMESVVIQERRS
jgi:glutathione-regulated potassium-efflux system ancillary protein KefC